MDERMRRKWLVVSAVSLLDWGLISGAALAVAYEEIYTAAIPLGVAAIVVVLAALVAWSSFLGSPWKLSAERLRRVRIASYFAYALLVGNGLLLLLPLGWRYLAAARPVAFVMYRVSTIGLLVMMILIGIALIRWQASLKSLEAELGSI